MKVKRLVFFTIIVSIVFYSCNSKSKKIENINNLKAEVYSEKDGYNAEKADKLIAAYVDFANKYPKDSSSASYLYDGANMCMHINKNDKAIELLDNILNNFSDHKQPDCIFLKAYIYENNIGDMDKAKKFYEELIEKFPEHKLAKVEAKFSLENLGKSAEEIFNIIQSKMDSTEADSVQEVI